MLEKKQTVDSDYILTSHYTIDLVILVTYRSDLNLILLLQFIFLMSSGFSNTHREAK